MPIEQAIYIDTLQPDWPTGTDPESAGDDHLRMIKQTLKNTFPNINAPVNATPETLNGITNHLGYTGDGSAGNPVRLEAHNDDWTGSIAIAFASPSVSDLNANAALGVNWAIIQSMLMPVGHVIFNTGTNPANYLGFGTWTQRGGNLYAVGTMTDAANAAVTSIIGGGAVPGYLQVYENHIVPVEYSGTLTMNPVEDHEHDFTTHGGNSDGTGGPRGNANDGGTGTIGTSAAGGHTPSGSASVTVGNASAGDHFILPGYSFYVWERTA